MAHGVLLTTTIAAAFGCALVPSFLAVRLRLPALVGYLIAGVLIGPATPGFVADLELSRQLAEIGIMLLMFGVGLHFSWDDLLAVRRIALPGAFAQIAVATALGATVASLWGWSVGEGIVFGLALSVASTVVLLRALETRGILASINGHIAVGWLVVEDIVMVLVLVLLPAVSVWLGGGAAPGAVQVPDTLRARKMIEIARALKPNVETVVRAHSDEEAALLRKEGAAHVFMGEHELALGMTRHVLERVAGGIGRAGSIVRPAE